jgi:ADP-ribosylglycohydrolase
VIESERIAAARLALAGLSIGDAFGERFFTRPEIVEALTSERAAPAGPWHYADDTQMALSIASVLEKAGEIDQEALARRLARHYDESRGYGPVMHGALARIRSGEPWSAVSRSLFGGAGSFGNGARVSAEDTVPFVLWSAARNLARFETARWETVSALGDRDTTCAIVGGIVALCCGEVGIPADWLERREPLPRWPE